MGPTFFKCFLFTSASIPVGQVVRGRRRGLLRSPAGGLSDTCTDSSTLILAGIGTRPKKRNHGGTGCPGSIAACIYDLRRRERGTLRHRNIFGRRPSRRPPAAAGWSNHARGRGTARRPDRVHSEFAAVRRSYG